MDSKLLLQACSKFIVGLFLIGILLFLPAGTFAFWNAWLFIGLLFDNHKTTHNAQISRQAQ